MKKVAVALLLSGLMVTQAMAADTIKIAITGPFTGGSAPMGVSMRDGAKLAIAEINAAGGVQVGDKKMKFEVIERDDEAKNERGALIGQELASMSDLSGVIGTREHRRGAWRATGTCRKRASPRSSPLPPDHRP